MEIISFETKLKSDNNKCSVKNKMSKKVKKKAVGSNHDLSIKEENKEENIQKCVPDICNEDETYQLYLGDCLEKMNSIPDDSVDLILCDLPYGTTKCKWDSIINIDDLWVHYKRVLKKPHGVILLFGQQPFTSMLISSNYSWFKYNLIWKLITEC